jgi:hypothetical protein
MRIATEDGRKTRIWKQGKMARKLSQEWGDERKNIIIVKIS